MSFENCSLFKALVYNNVDVNTMQFIEIEESTRIYYYKVDEKEKAGFNFIVLEMIGYYIDEDNEKVKNSWEKPSAYVECLYHGYAAYDGMRHLFMGHHKNDNEGYLYCIDMKRQILTFQALEKLVDKYCKLIN